jgi:sialate O-acetylesterase
MINPLIPYAIRGVIWYQGEANTGRAYQYRDLFPRLVRDWRKRWGLGDFPFLFVQLANFMPVKQEPGEDSWAELREAQLLTLRESNTGMAVAIDIGDADDIHPKNKQDVGRRLALNALKIAYEKDIVSSGPIYAHMFIEGNKMRLQFTNIGDGLVTKNGEGLRGFTITGEDRVFRWAEAVIEGDSVVLWHPQIKKPVAARYAWASNPVCNLYNSAELPASPFRTDDWPGITEH